MCRDLVAPVEEICGNLRDEDCDGEDLREPDEFEVNNTCDTCFMLNGGEDDPSDLELRANIDSIGDEDYFCFNADDGSNPLNLLWREEINLSLDRIPNGSDYELRLYRGLENCRNENHLAQSTNGGNDDEEIQFTEALNFNDGGLYIIKVYAYTGDAELNWNDCDDFYRLTVDGLD